MNSYENLEKFSLECHGDAREREWGRSVVAFFPAYEVFWRRYVVPLTNRIRPEISQEDQGWIRIRPEISDRLERMTMSHYSVFYCFARAIAQMSSPTEVYPEDVFALLAACGENVLKFAEEISHILRDFGIDGGFLPMHVKDLCGPTAPDGCFVEVNDYRNKFLHFPVLGRRAGLERQYLPKRDPLKAVERSWRAAERLTPGELIDSDALFSRLRREIAEFMQEKWGHIIRCLDGVRESEKFKKQWALRELPPIDEPKVVPLVVQPLAASGVSWGSATFSPTASGAMILPRGTGASEQDP
jgi:hypothetical protein